MSRLDENAARVAQMLCGATIERTRDAIQLTEDGDPGVVALVTAEAIELRLPTIEWTGGAHGPVATSRLWKRVRLPIRDAKLRERVEAAREARRAEFVPCRFCHRPTPPEHRLEDDRGDVCHSCAARELGVVF